MDKTSRWLPTYNGRKLLFSIMKRILIVAINYKTSKFHNLIHRKDTNKLKCVDKAGINSSDKTTEPTT